MLKLNNGKWEDVTIWEERKTEVDTTSIEYRIRKWQEKERKEQKAVLESESGKTAKTKPIRKQDAKPVNYDKIDSIPHGFLDAEDMVNCTESDLFRLERDELERICEGLEVPKSGNKSVKIHNIMEGIQKYAENVTWVTNIDIPAGMDAYNYIVENGLHELVCFLQVRKMAFKGTPKYDDTGKIIGFRPYKCQDGCYRLMINPRDITWNDARQETALALLEQIGGVSVKNGYPVLSPDAFRAVRNHISRMFNNMRLNYGNSENRPFAINCEMDEKTGKVTEKVIGLRKDSDSSYIMGLSYNANYENIANNDLVIGIFKWIKNQKKYAKYYESMKHVFAGKITGKNNKAIMEEYGITRRIFEKCIILLKDAYTEYVNISGCGFTGKNTTSIFHGNTYYKADTSASGSYGFSYGDYCTGYTDGLTEDQLINILKHPTTCGYDAHMVINKLSAIWDKKELNSHYDKLLEDAHRLPMYA